MNHVKALQEEINVLKERTHPMSTKGHLGIQWTISTLEDRVKEINEILEKNKMEEPMEAHDG